MKVKALFATILTVLALHTPAAMAAGSTNHSGQASTHSALATSHATVAGAKLAAGAVAVPLIIVGEAGKASGAAGEHLWDAAHASIGAPLPVADETYLTGPAPDIAIQQ